MTTVGVPDTARLTLTVDETAELLGIGRAAAYRAINRGEIESLRIGRRLLVPRLKLLALLGVEDEVSS